jgi:2',3'-cyclic-nucleotide 2'-phosphodiesterase (5'-nucleotidase family)
MRNRGLLVAVGLAWLLSSSTLWWSAVAQTPSVPAHVLGTDDKAAFAIHFSGEMHANLDTCGCPANPSGGLHRRVTMAQAFRTNFAETPLLELSVGAIFNDQGVLLNPPFKDVLVQNDYALRGYSAYPFDAVNLTYQDLRVLHRYFTNQSARQAAADFPVLKAYISANATPAVNEKTHITLPRFVIKEVKSPHIPKNHKLRIGVTGVCEQAPSEGTGYVWRDPATALKEVLPELKKQADVVVVLAYLPLDQAKTLAAELEGIDVMIVGHTQPSLLTLETVGNTAVVVNNYETKALGELRAYVTGDGRRTYSSRFILLDATIPSEPNALKIVREAKAAVEEARRSMVQSTP